MGRVFFTLVLLAGSIAHGAHAAPLSLSLRGTPPATVERFARYEIAFDLSRHYDDPFDPEVIDVVARFTAPSGREILVDAFYYVDFPPADLMDLWQLGASKEQPPPATGHPGAHWRVRFAAQEEGPYKARLEARDKQGVCHLDLPAFTATASDNPGFIRARAGRRMLEHEGGGPFVPIGECLWLCRSLQDYEDSLTIYPRWGMNYCRLFTAYDSPVYIDNAFYAGGARRPPGQLDLFALRQLDIVFDTAARHGVYLMPCLEMFNAFRITPPYERWEASPYNAVNGGPCATVRDFFTDERAIRLYERKLRYFLARYGHAPNLFCIQLFAEANYIDGYDEAAVRAWHHRMGRFIHRIDPYGHLVSTSLADWEAQDKAMYADEGLDIVLNENYNARDFAGDMIQDNQGIWERYGKPVFDGEAGLQFGELALADERGLFLHDGIWASVLSGACGTPSNWFHTEARAKHWLPSYKAFADFLSGEDLRGLDPVHAELVSFAPSTIHPDQVIPFPFTQPAGATGPQTVVVPNDRFLDRAIPNMPTVFSPRYQRDGVTPNPTFNPVTFIVDFAADGAFRARARWLEDFNGGHATMRISVDGAVATEARLGAEADTRPDWSSSMKCLERSSVPFSARVPRGKHTIVLENLGTIWASIEVDLANAVKAEVPNVRVVGMGSGERAYLWIQNRDSTWWRDYLDEPPRPIEQATIRIGRFQPGSYGVEWVDPWGGGPARREMVESRDGHIDLLITRLERDIACKVKRVHSGK